jgi:hypothetical protein
MRNSVFLLLLAISVVVNVWLFSSRVGARMTNASPSAPAASSTSSAASALPARSSGPQVAATAAAPAAFVWPAGGTSDTELRQLANSLRAAGFPPPVVAGFIGELLRDRTSTEVAQLPFWQLTSPGREARKLQSAAARELLRLQEEILGPAGAPVATLDPLQRRHDYGSLGDADVAALLRIERDYQELRMDLMNSSPSVSREEMDVRRKAMEDLEKERLADIAAALSPEEFAEWERRSSPAANRVGMSLREVTVSEDEYLALLAIEKARNPYQRAFVSSFAPAVAETAAFLDKVRGTLGDERAHAYLKAADFNYGMVARAAEKLPGMTPAKSAELYKLQLEAGAAMITDPAGAPRDPAKVQATLTGLNARLETLLGADAAAAYRAQPAGALFNAFRPRPSPAATPPKG